MTTIKHDKEYWIYQQDGPLYVQYNKAFNRFGWERLKAIAEKTLKLCAAWDGVGIHKAEAGHLDGVMYLAFPITDPKGIKIVVIETQDGFEKAMKVKLADLAEYNYVQDGQHKHEGHK